MISQNNIDKIVNAKTLDDFLEAQESIINELTQNDNLNDENMLIVRIPSINEYNIFIINDTLDGSIINNDNNVWHKHSLNFIFLTITNRYNCNFDIDSIVNHINTNIDNRIFAGESFKNLKNYDGIGLRNADTNQTINWRDFVSYIELHSDNNSQYFNINSQICKICNFNVWFTNYYAIATECRYNTYIPTQFDKKLSNQQINISTTAVNLKTNYSYSIYLGFRPIFQYKDTNKSTNIFL